MQGDCAEGYRFEPQSGQKMLSQLRKLSMSTSEEYLSKLQTDFFVKLRKSVHQLQKLKEHREYKHRS